VHAHIGAQCADTVEAGVDADGPACILHMGMGSGSMSRQKAERGCLRNA